MIYIYICSGCNWTSKQGFKLSVANIAITCLQGFCQGRKLLLLCCHLTPFRG